MDTPTQTEEGQLPSVPASTRPLLRPIYTVLIFIFGILIGTGGILGYQEFLSSPSISTYEECVKVRGSSIQESFPPTCVTRDGKRFTQPTVDDGINPIYTDPLSCNTDRDCTIGIVPTGCCMCPEAINKEGIGKDGWETYMPGKDYGKGKTCQTFVVCAPCELPTTSVCRSNLCVFDNGATPSPVRGYTCPENGWESCMPILSEEGQRQCSPEALAWKKANCPNFQGAAL